MRSGYQGHPICCLRVLHARGCPREYAFLVEITGSPSTSAFKRALQEAQQASAELRVVGSYPFRKPYKS